VTSEPPAARAVESSILPEESGVMMFQTRVRRGRVQTAVACAAILSAALLGCGSGFDVAPVTGKVTCNGKPVSVGGVSFTPIAEEGASAEPGKPASGSLKPDGTFSLSTYEAMDGAVVGKHRVQYFGPEDEEAEEESFTADADSGLAKAKDAERARERQEALKSLCVQNAQIMVEVKAGGPNDFTIELKSDEEDGDSGD